MTRHLCGCGNCQDAFDSALADQTKSIENGECLLWRIGIATAMTAQCVLIVQEFFRREGQPMNDTDARLYVVNVIGALSPTMNDALAAATPKITAAFDADEARRSGRKN